MSVLILTLVSYNLTKLDKMQLINEGKHFEWHILQLKRKYACVMTQLLFGQSVLINLEQARQSNVLNISALVAYKILSVK